MTDRDPEILAKLDQVLEVQRRQGERLASIEGQLSVLMSWVQSIDQRFVSLMTPVSPPRNKPAAE